MTELLEKAMQRVASLSQEEQDAIASQIFETLEEEDTRRRKLAEEALAEDQGGETRPIEDLL